ncbi:DUF305 domain-containing protein [Pantoea eucalypti]|jgi:uncharacterized protein (DUF305 family)|uniref:DUF305 domain-containing protein n=1 Tax=Pantoea eucalypti TaxID=470933 RepID=UPI000D78B9B2|nr:MULTISPECIES: DUF305 domain-containing protein [Pantoea]AWP34970.1 DUF305 domain-containing protein [Pantoea vagans]MDJ0475188.1 DUF305 domain-containing protein [Pantoea eucalypti]QXG56844.1 DUF305 domain-containing protein [Pantoea jilinensis]TPD93703.1 DUF305 domain-containing protein [Pantoea vagans]
MNRTLRCFLIANSLLVLSQSAGAHDHPSANANAPAVLQEQGFWKENEQAMDTMMSRMAIEPTGNVDEDFVAMMTPHHQGAMDMAVAELRYGKNEQLRRIAQEIIVTQQQEIVAMYQALGKPLPPAAPAPDQVQPDSAPAAPQGN